MKIIIRLIFLFCIYILMGNLGFAQLSVEDAVSEYLEAVQTHKPELIAEAWESLNEHESFVSYLKVNRPEVYERLLEEYENRYEDREQLDEDESWSVDDQAGDFPVRARRSNRDIVETEPNNDRWSNRRVALEFPNQKRPSNREIIKQRKRQDRDIDQGDVYFERDDYPDGDMIMLTISGLNRREYRSIEEILADEIQSINSIDEISFNNGVAVFLLSIDGNADDFSDRLENHSFPTFTLDLVRFRPNRLDFIFKSL